MRWTMNPMLFPHSLCPRRMAQIDLFWTSGSLIPMSNISHFFQFTVRCRSILETILHWLSIGSIQCLFVGALGYSFLEGSGIGSGWAVLQVHAFVLWLFEHLTWVLLILIACYPVGIKMYTLSNLLICMICFHFRSLSPNMARIYRFYCRSYNEMGSV